MRLSSSWESDVTTHSLTLASTTCLELLLILTGNNATLPPSLHSMDSFQILHFPTSLQGHSNHGMFVSPCGILQYYQALWMDPDKQVKLHQITVLCICCVVKICRKEEAKNM
ncbi:E3 ubiquitin-protein ligase E3D [Manis javanica]|nr:E3 ubiquitin-protein ligase E3D [Manis javanica]